MIECFISKIYLPFLKSWSREINGVVVWNGIVVMWAKAVISSLPIPFLVLESEICYKLLETSSLKPRVNGPWSDGPEMSFI